jgi:phospholipid/cholesterol/gamma-HCH transport system permease protein
MQVEWGRPCVLNLGTMAVTEQLDANKVLGLSHFKFLLPPVSSRQSLCFLYSLSLVFLLEEFWRIVVANLPKEDSWHVFFYGVRMFMKTGIYAVGLIKSCLVCYINCKLCLLFWLFRLIVALKGREKYKSDSGCWND